MLTTILLQDQVLETLYVSPTFSISHVSEPFLIEGDCLTLDPICVYGFEDECCTTAVELRLMMNLTF